MNIQELNFSNLSELLRKWGDLIISLYRQELVKTRSDDTGALGNSLNYIVETQDGDYEVNFSLLDYWEYVEEGRAAGKFPPLSDIKSWIKTKPVIPRPYNGKLPTVDQLAYLIGRKIHLQGTQGKHPLANTIEYIENNYMELLDDAITKDLQGQVDYYLFKNF